MIPIDRALVVTDTETTGLSPAQNRIIEIGAIRLFDGEEDASFSRLVDPGVSIPYRITRLTGITSSMVYGCPPAAEAMEAYLEFLGDGVLVAHNLTFDRGFLNAECSRAGREPLANPGLCTARLARRLLPGLRSKSLASLAKFFRIEAHGRHRALRDVEITVQVLRRLMEIASREHGIDGLDGLLELQSRTYARINPFSRHILEIRREVLPDVPESPGVYRMLDGRGRVLYVGKAKVLSRRVRSYFNAIEAHTPRIRQLVSRLRGVDWTETPTELEALLLESQLIRELEPPFNRAQRKTIPRPYLRIDTSHDYPRITANVYPREDDAEYYGPLRSRAEAAAVIEIVEMFFRIRTCDDREFKTGKRCLRADIDRCAAPCEGDYTPESYAMEVERIRRFLSGETGDVEQLLESKMNDLSEATAFEEAARLRDLLTLVRDRVSRTGRIAVRVFEDDAVVLCNDKEAGLHEILIIRAGRFVSSVRAFDPDSHTAVERLGRALAIAYGESDATETRGLVHGANEIRVLQQWLYANREKTNRIPRDPEEKSEDLCSRVLGVAKTYFSSIPNPVDR